jgi:hypothetical protein
MRAFSALYIGLKLSRPYSLRTEEAVHVLSCGLATTAVVHA